MPEIKQLNENLKRQAALYNELKEFAQRKQQALVKNDLREIEATTLREEQLLLEVSRLEKERLLWAEQIAKRLGKAPENITLSELAERFPELKDVKEDLEDILKKIREINDLNTQLLKQAIKVVDLTIGLMTSQPQGTVYGRRPGEKDNEPKGNIHFIDRSI